MTAYDVVRTGERTVLVLGQELDVGAGKPDIANVVVHRVNETVFVIDTGVTERCRAVVKDALDQVGPWRKMMLFTTHGHTRPCG